MNVSPRKRQSRRSLPKPRAKARNADADAVLRKPRLRLEESEKHEAQHRDERHADEDGAPSERHDQCASDQRREDRRDGEDQHHQRHQPRRLDACVHVAHDGARHHHHGGGADALQRAEGNQPTNRRRERAADRAEPEKRQPEIERRLAADHVGDRAVDDLADAESDEEDHQRHLRRRRRRTEVLGDRRQRRKIHVDREGADGGEKTEHNRALGEARKHGRGLSEAGSGAGRERLFAR